MVEPVLSVEVVAGLLQAVGARGDEGDELLLRRIQLLLERDRRSVVTALCPVNRAILRRRVWAPIVVLWARTGTPR